MEESEALPEMVGADVARPPVNQRLVAWMADLLVSLTCRCIICIFLKMTELSL